MKDDSAGKFLLLLNSVILHFRDNVETWLIECIYAKLPKMWRKLEPRIFCPTKAWWPATRVCISRRNLQKFLRIWRVHQNRHPKDASCLFRNFHLQLEFRHYSLWPWTLNHFWWWLHLEGCTCKLRLEFPSDHGEANKVWLAPGFLLSKRQTHCGCLCRSIQASQLTHLVSSNLFVDARWCSTEGKKVVCEKFQ